MYLDIDYLFVAIFFYIYVICSLNKIVIVFPTSCFFIIRKKFKELLFFLVLIISVTALQNIKIDKEKYIITGIKSNYYLASNLVYKVEIFTTDELVYGDFIVIDNSELKPLSRNISTYGYNSDKFYQTNNIKYSANKYEYLKHLPNLPSFIIKRIEKFSNEEYKFLLKKMIFNINNYEHLNDFICDTGLNYYGINLSLSYILDYFFNKERKRKTINIIFIILLFINPCFQIINYLAYRYISSKIKDRSYALGIQISLILLLFPYKALSISFILPTLFRLFSLFNLSKSSYLSLIFIINSYFFNEVNIVKTILFKFYSILNGSFTLLFIFTLFSVTICGYVCNFFLFITNILSLINFNLYGHIGLIGIVLIYLLIKTFNKFKVKTLLITLLIISLNLNNLFMSVSFINVGHGDATLIKSPFNKETILIDTGSNTNYYQLDSYLKGKGVNKIDYLIITHFDEDHSGNIENLKNDYHVNKIISGKEDIKSKYFYLLQLNKNSFKNVNTNSNCYLTRINNLNYLLTGDIDNMTESTILRDFNNLDVDVLKVAHHGSNTSSSSKFIKQISPIISVISCSNKYGFPSNKTLSNLDNNLSKIFITKESGDIEIICTKFWNIIKTSDNQIIVLKN